MPLKFLSKDSVSFPQEKKQQVLSIVFVVIIIIAIIILYFGIWRSPSSPDEPFEDPDLLLVAKNISSVEKVINRIDFDVSFLKKPSFQNLKVYSQWPLEIGLKGKENPFSSQ